MVVPIPFDPRRFRSTAAHYHARSPYPPRLIERVAAACGLGPASRVMDLGCGPGPLAIAFAPRVGAVLAVDPEPEMLAQARFNAQGVGGRIEFVEGSSRDLGPALGRFRLVTIGRAFHWMDRVETLRRLDAMIEPGGAVALFHDERPRLPENVWVPEFQATIERHADAGDPPAWQRPDWLRHEAILLDSPFGALEKIAVVGRRRFPAEQLVARALSTSRCSPARLGAGAERLAAEIAELARRIAPDGIVTEVVESVATIARRA